MFVFFLDKHLYLGNQINRVKTVISASHKDTDQTENSLLRSFRDGTNSSKCSQHRKCLVFQWTFTCFSMDIYWFHYGHLLTERFCCRCLTAGAILKTMSGSFYFVIVVTMIIQFWNGVFASWKSRIQRRSPPSEPVHSSRCPRPRRWEHAAVNNMHLKMVDKNSTNGCVGIRHCR